MGEGESEEGGGEGERERGKVFLKSIHPFNEIQFQIFIPHSSYSSLQCCNGVQLWYVRCRRCGGGRGEGRGERGEGGDKERGDNTTQHYTTQHNTTQHNTTGDNPHRMGVSV